MLCVLRLLLLVARYGPNMSMTPDLAIHLAQHEAAGKPINQVMRAANEIFKANSDGWNPPFSQVDVEFATFLDFLKETGTPRERDLVYISDTLTRTWKVLHLNSVLGEKLTAADLDDIQALSKALNRVGLLNLITDGLRDDLVSLVRGFAESV